MAFKMKGNPFPKKNGAYSPQKQRVNNDEVKMFSEDWKNEEEVPLTYEEELAKWQEHSDYIDARNREIDIENQILQNKEDLMTDKQKSDWRGKYILPTQLKMLKFPKMSPPPKPPDFSYLNRPKIVYPNPDVHEMYHDKYLEIENPKIIRRKKGSDFE